MVEWGVPRIQVHSPESQNHFTTPWGPWAESGSFSYKNSFYLKPRVTQPTSSPWGLEGEEFGTLKKKNGGVSLSLGNQYSFPDLRLPGPNWTAVNCPICCQDQPHGLQRILAKEGLLQGWGWVGRWRPKFRHPMGPGAAGDCPASWLHFESKAFHNPHPSCQSQHAQGPGPVWSGHFPLHTCCSEVLGFRKPLSMGQSPPKPQPAVWVFSLPQVIMAFWAFLLGFSRPPKGLN